MGQGAQSKALIIANKTQFGFDAAKVYNADGSVWTDISNFDKAPELFVNQKGTGTLPEGLHDSYPEANAPNVSDGVSWEVGLGGSPQPDRKTHGADPTPGGGWSEGL